MMARITLLLITLASTSLASEATVVQLEGQGGKFSGVIVSPSGLIVTADHCGKANSVNVRLRDGTARVAVLRYAPPHNGIDEAQVYQITGGGEFPFSPLGKSPAGVGDEVSSFGYSERSFERRSGQVIETGFVVRSDGNYDLELSDGLVTDWKSSDGTSGGPLFNSKGEVIGILSMSGTWPRSYWINLPSITEAIRRSQFPTHKQRLVMFSVPGDKDCELYEKEIKATSNGILVIRTDSDEFPQWKSSYEAFTRQKLDKFPTFWAEGTNQTKSAKYQPGFLGSLLSWFRGILQALLGGLFGSPATPSTPPQQYTRGSLPPPPVEVITPKTPEEEILDPSNVTVVILVKKQDLGLAKGVVAKTALLKAAGPLQRKLDEVLGGRVRLVLVPERTRPDRFLAVAEAAKTEADPAAVFVLVRSQSLGLKSLIAGKVEKTILGKIPEKVPVDVVFERIRPDDFHAILEATYAGEVPDPQVVTVPGEQPEEPAVPNGLLMGLFSSTAAAWGSKELMARARNKAKEKGLSIITEKLHRKPGEGEEA
jgi:hypothetical protein